VIAKGWYWLGLIGSGSLIAIAYFYFQLHVGLAPCPLCMFQRACLVGVAFFCLLGIITKPKKIGARLLAFGCLVSSGLGLAIAGRHVWLQHLPEDQVPECGPDLSYMMEQFPFMQVIEKVLQGSGECAEVHQYFGLSIPEWMALIFVVMVILSIKLLFTKERNYFSGTLGR